MIQDFKGIVGMRGLTVTQDEGSITVPEYEGELANFESGESLPTILSKQQAINAALGDLAYKDENELGLPADPFGDLATKNENELLIPAKTSDLENDSGFGRPIAIQEYIVEAPANFDDDITITLPEGRTAADIFQIIATIITDSDLYVMQGGLGIAEFSFLSVRQNIYVCTVIKLSLASGIYTNETPVGITLDLDDFYFSNFGVAGAGVLKIYYK